MKLILKILLTIIFAALSLPFVILASLVLGVYFVIEWLWETLSTFD